MIASMYKHTGNKYEAVKSMDLTAIAKLVRKDIKAAHPAIKASVRCHKYSMGQSLYVSVDGVFSPEAGRALKDSIEMILGEYNRKETDCQTDYYNTNFFSSVSVNWPYEQEVAS